MTKIFNFHGFELQQIRTMHQPQAVGKKKHLQSGKCTILQIGILRKARSSKSSNPANQNDAKIMEHDKVQFKKEARVSLFRKK